MTINYCNATPSLTNNRLASIDLAIPMSLEFGQEYKN
jgi:hypothetical protein